MGELGRFVEAAEYAAEALRLAEPMHQVWPVGWAHLSAGMALLVKGDWAKGRSSVEHAIVAYRTGNISLSLSFAVALSAWALAQLGEAGEALTRLLEGERLVQRSVASGLRNAAGYRALGRAALLLGRLDDARRLGDCSLTSNPGPYGPHLLGDIATHPDRFDAASGEAHYRKALALAEARGMRPLIAHCHLGLGKLSRRTGKRDEAQEHLATATTMYRDMEMRFWLEQAEAESKELR